MSSHPARPIITRLRRRMLMALGRGTAPLSRAAAYALLPDLAARFAANDDLASAQHAAFFAALNADPDLAESFAILAEAIATTGAVTPSPNLAARLATIPRRAAVPALAPLAPTTFGQPIAVARVMEAWHQRATATPTSLPPVPPPATSDPPARLLREEATAPYDLRGPQEIGASPDHEPPIIQLTDPTGAQPPVDLVLTAQQATDTRLTQHSTLSTQHLTLHLREPATATASPHAWRVTARLGPHTLTGTFTAPGTWEPSRPLTPAEFARLILMIEPAG